MADPAAKWSKEAGRLRPGSLQQRSSCTCVGLGWLILLAVRPICDVLDSKSRIDLHGARDPTRPYRTVHSHGRSASTCYPPAKHRRTEVLGLQGPVDGQPGNIEHFRGSISWLLTPPQIRTATAFVFPGKQYHTGAVTLHDYPRASDTAVVDQASDLKGCNRVQTRWQTETSLRSALNLARPYKLQSACDVSAKLMPTLECRSKGVCWTARLSSKEHLDLHFTD